MCRKPKKVSWKATLFSLASLAALAVGARYKP
jgi:hypothetical protein